jgi:adenine-specific DNA-methyltransferase
MDKLKMHSPDLTASNIDKIAELFPSVITESIDEHGETKRAIDFDLLRQELSDYVVEGPQERYQLDWPGKRAAAFAANAPIAKTLRPVREESVDFDTTKNLFIEGDNLDALKLLQESYLGKVDLIYIDPPYNTGTDFIYEDDFAMTTAEYLARSAQTAVDGTRLVSNTEANGRFHSDWLSMMLPRLKLARNLLAESGTIFISIADEEVAQLRVLCDAVFGPACFIALLTVEMSTTQGMKVRAAQLGAIVKNCEFVLVYGKSAGRPDVTRTPLFDPVSGWPGNFTTWLHEDLSFEPLSAVLNRNPDLVAEAKRIVGGNSVRIADLTVLYAASSVFREFVHSNLDRIAASDKGSWPADVPEPDWKDGQAYEIRANDRTYVVMRSGKGTYRQFLCLADNFRTADDYASTYGRTVIRGDLWKGFYSDMAHVSLEGETPFPNGKKPVRLIENLIRWANNGRNITVLDFFAGSGTTGDAVMRMNAVDGGARRFLLTQLDEPAEGVDGFTNIAELSRARLRRAGARLLAGDHHDDWDSDVGFRVLCVDTTNMADVLRAPDEAEQTQLDLSVQSVKPDRTGEDLLFQVLLSWGLELSLPISVEQINGHEVMVVDGGAVIACFDKQVDLEVVRQIAKREPLRAVFLDAGFRSDDARINAEQIFREVSPSTEVRTI